MSSTLTPKTTRADVGVIVGRFQVHELHEAHVQLIEYVRSHHDACVIILGVAPIRNTINNPLDVAARRRMIHEQYPTIEVYDIADVRSDVDWSHNLDTMLRQKILKPTQTAVLYGSRTSFLSSYCGTFPTCELESTLFISGTEIRKTISNTFLPTLEFRAGVIASTFDRWPLSIPTVDVAVVDRSKRRVLLARKPTESLFRFPGGFADVASESYEADATREIREETGLEIANLRYIGSFKIDDWRYRGTPDTIKTMFYMADYIFGSPTPQDDISMLKWVSFDDLRVEDVVDEHQTLMAVLKTHLI